MLNSLTRHETPQASSKNDYFSKITDVGDSPSSPLIESLREVFEPVQQKYANNRTQHRTTQAVKQLKMDKVQQQSPEYHQSQDKWRDRLIQLSARSNSSRENSRENSRDGLRSGSQRNPRDNSQTNSRHSHSRTVQSARSHRNYPLHHPWKQHHEARILTARPSQQRHSQQHQTPTRSILKTSARKKKRRTKEAHVQWQEDLSNMLLNDFQ